MTNDLYALICSTPTEKALMRPDLRFDSITAALMVYNKCGAFDGKRSDVLDFDASVHGDVANDLTRSARRGR